jgi:hypothetical protein
MAIFCAALVGVLIAVLVPRIRPSPQLTLTRFSIPLGEGQTFTSTGRHLLAISRDGTQIVYVANYQLYLRSMSENDARAIPGTHFPMGVLTPVFSPDGASLAFFAANAIKGVPLTGGTPITVCDLQASPFGMTWEADSIVVGTGEQGIKRCPANGGSAEQVISVKDGEAAQEPQMLPGGRSVLYTLATGNSEDRWDRAKIFVEPIGSGKRTIDRRGNRRTVPADRISHPRPGRQPLLGAVRSGAIENWGFRPGRGRSPARRECDRNSTVHDLEYRHAYLCRGSSL